MLSVICSLHLNGTSSSRLMLSSILGRLSQQDLSVALLLFDSMTLWHCCLDCCSVSILGGCIAAEFSLGTASFFFAHWKRTGRIYLSMIRVQALQCQRSVILESVSCNNGLSPLLLVLSDGNGAESVCVALAPITCSFEISGNLHDNSLGH